MTTVKPDTIVKQAQKKLNQTPRDTQITDQGFVLEHTYGDCVFVGYQLEEPIDEIETSEYAVAKLWRETETIGRGDPKIQTSKNTHLECKVYRMELPANPREDIEDVNLFIEHVVAKRIDEREYKEQICKGWINGYRLPNLEAQVREHLK